MNITIDDTLDQLAEQASAGSGQSYHWYCHRFTTAVDAFLGSVPSEQHARVIEIAKARGYGDDDSTEDSCMHGIDPHCCPAGCGDIDYNDYSHIGPAKTCLSERDVSILVDTLLAHVDLVFFVDGIRGETFKHTSARAEHFATIICLAEHICEEAGDIALPGGGSVGLLLCLAEREHVATTECLKSRSLGP